MIVNATSYFIWREAGTGQDDESIARELPKRFAFSGAPPSANELREIVSNHLLLLQQVKVLEEACPGDAADPVEAL